MFQKSQSQLQEIFKSYGIGNQKSTDKSYLLQAGQVKQEGSKLVRNEKNGLKTLPKLLLESSTSETDNDLDTPKSVVENSNDEKGFYQTEHHVTSITESIKEESLGFPEQIKTKKHRYRRNSKPTENELEESLNHLEKRYCHLCKKVYRAPEILKNHIQSCHNQSKNSFLCPTCGHTSKSKSGMHAHVIAKHEGSVHKCDVCNKTFPNSSNLKQHQVSHENARRHLCNVCGKSFNFTHALKYHMRVHTGEKKYKCPHCDRRFRMPCTLKGHIRSHTGARPFKCGYCEKTYRWKTSCTMHEMTHTSYRPYHCKHCGKGYINSYNLKVHILGHPGPHSCEICNKSFLEMEYVKMHLRMFHKDLFVKEENCLVEEV